MGVVFLAHYQTFGCEKIVLGFQFWWPTIEFKCLVLGVHVGSFAKKSWIIFQGTSLVMGHELIFIMQKGNMKGTFNV
jgi:hypothetical protein